MVALLKPSKKRLEEEFAFSVTMASFIRSIRMGIIDVRHCSILLTHYGRLGFTFDATNKVLVEILREEGMLRDNGEIVSSICAQALREVSHL